MIYTKSDIKKAFDAFNSAGRGSELIFESWFNEEIRGIKPKAPTPYAQLDDLTKICVNSLALVQSMHDLREKEHYLNYITKYKTGEDVSVLEKEIDEIIKQIVFFKKRQAEIKIEFDENGNTIKKPE